MNPRVVVLPLLVLLAGAGIALATRDREPAKPPAGGKGPAPPPDDGVPRGPWYPQNVRTHLAPSTERIPCRVRAPKPVTLFPSVASTPVEAIHVREGQAVRKGDLLLTFGAAQWERALAAAEKAGDARRIGEAKRALASLEVRAPEDGIVYSMAARRGERPLELDGAPAPLVVLFDWRRLSYEATAPAALAEILARNPQVFVRSGRDFLIEGEIVVNGPAAADGSIPLVLHPKSAPLAVPEPDGEGEIAVMTGTHEVRVVPTAAVRRAGGRDVVYMVGITGDLTARPVVRGLPVEGGFVEVSGVKMGESVAVWK